MSDQTGNPHGEHGKDWHWMIFIYSDQSAASLLPSWSESDLRSDVKAMEVPQARKLAASLFQHADCIEGDCKDIPELSTFDAIDLRAALAPLTEHWANYQNYLKNFVPGQTRRIEPMVFIKWLDQYGTPNLEDEQTLADQFEQAFKLLNPSKQEDDESDADSASN